MKLNLNKISGVISTLAWTAVSVAIGTTAVVHTVNSVKSLKKKKDKVVIHFYEDETDVMPHSEPVEADSSDVVEAPEEKRPTKAKKA